MMRVRTFSLVLLVTALATAGVTPASAAISLNLKESFADTKAILAGGGQADVVMFGDSLTFGIYPTLRDRFQARYGNAGEGYQPVSRWTGAGLDAGWLEGAINSDIVPHRSLDGMFVQSKGTPTGGYLNVPTNRVDLQYAATPAGGTFTTYNGYGGPQIAQIDTNNPVNAVKTWSGTLKGVSQLGFATHDANVTLLGANNKTDDPGIRLHRAANGGWGVDNFLQRDWTFDAQLPLLSPDLAFIWLGTNDPEYDRAGYRTLIGKMVDRIRGDLPETEIVLIANYDLGYDPSNRLGVEDVALEKGLGFINLYEAAGPHSLFVKNGWLSDDIHFSASGNAYMSDLLMGAFVTDGASLVPEPAGLAVLTCAAGSLVRRRPRGVVKK